MIRYTSFATKFAEIYTAGYMTAGETLALTGVEFSGYSDADGYSVQARFNRNGNNPFVADGVANGSSWDFTASYAMTADLYPGSYTFAVYATNGANRFVIEDGIIGVADNPAATPPEATMLAAIDAQLLSAASAEQRTVKIADVELQFLSPAQLQKYHSQYRHLLAKRQRISQSIQGRQPNTIYTRFT